MAAVKSKPPYFYSVMLSGAILWGAVALLSAYLTPALWNHSFVTQRWVKLAPLITGVVIAVNLGVMWQCRRLYGQRSVSLLRALVLFALFAILFFQFAVQWEANHYRWQEAPTWQGWLGFTASHALRAADVLDGLQAYGYEVLGLRIEKVRGDSHVVKATLVVFHLMMNLFVLNLLFDWISRARLQRLEARQRSGLDFGGEYRFLKWYTVFGVLTVGPWALTALKVRRWQQEDLIGWWVENFLRLIDLPDIIEIYDLHLHQVPASLWIGTLTLFCRLWLAVGLLRFWRFFSLKFLGGFGLSNSALEIASVASSYYSISQTANTLLSKRQNRVGHQIRLREPGKVFLLSTLVFVLPVLAWMFSERSEANWDRHAWEMTLTLGDQAASEKQKQAAIHGLQRMGSYAESTVPQLLDSLEELSVSEQKQRIQTATLLGPAGRYLVALEMKHWPENLAVFGTEQLIRLGPQAVPALVIIQDQDSRLQIQKLAAAACDRAGSKAIPWLIAEMSPENAYVFARQLDELSQYWTWAMSSNPDFAPVAETWEFVGKATHPAGPQMDEEDDEIDFDLIKDFEKWGNRASYAAAPLFELYIDHRDNYQSRRFTWLDHNLEEILGAIGRPTVELMLTRIRQPVVFENKWEEERSGQWYHQSTKEFGEILNHVTDPQAAYRLADELDDPLPRVRLFAVETIGGIARNIRDVRADYAMSASEPPPLDREFVPRVTQALIIATDDPETRIRQAALKSLDIFSKGLQPHLPKLRELLEDEDLEVRNAAKEMVERLEGDPQ